MSIEISSIEKMEGHVHDTAESKLSEIERFKESLTRRRRKNADSEYFVPQDVISSQTSQELVRKILSETSLERYSVEELVPFVVSHAPTTFAILVIIGRPESILAFVEDDQMQPHSIDRKLPLDLHKLLVFLDNESAAAHFYGQQWAFIAPVFSASSLPRALEKRTVLPFTESKELGKGGFGEVHEIQIEPSHHSFAHSGQNRFVRKELRPWSTKIDYELELRNLSVLKLLKHSCIIELLACFTYRDKFNFIFSLANGGTLADLLSGKRPSPYEKPEDFLIALCGLSSAVRAVHTFLVDDFEAIGCHHDLKPSNVLLHGSKLLLADFGLSRFKDLGEGSASYFRGGRGDFIAPECEDLGEDFKKHIVHRSSDVWSFGCIISEVLTFLQGGVEGVRTFRSSRMFEIENIKYFRFHSGSNIPNPQVWSWLAQLGRKDDRRHVHFLIHVIGLSLELQPERRSNITVVDKWLRFIAIDFLADETERLFEGICYRNKLIPALVEKQRFKSWRCIMEALATSAQPQEDSFLSANNYNDFEAMVLAVKELYQTLQSTILESSKPQWRLFLPLRKINDTLYHTLPSDNSRASARMHFECHLLESQDSTQLQELSEAMSGQSGSDTHIGHLAAVKRLKLLVENSIADQGERTCQIDHDAIDRTRFIQDFYIGRLNQKEKRPPSPNVLVEAKNYDDHYSIDSVARELFGRLEAIVRLLNTAGSLRVLHCQGYYHHPGTYSLGLVYNYPELQYPDQQQPQQVPDVSTLHEILKQDIAGRHRPLLGDRFRLAHSLASSLFEFHKVNWVQKAISAFNIVFFRPPMALSWKDHMSEPYFMGFLASRQDEEACFTEGPTDDSQHRQYLCPEYLRDRQRFLQHYDYYSLGLVLLELGLWRTLGDIRRGEAFQGSPEKFRDALLRIAVPRLGQTMGAVYQSAVEECLRWELQESEQSGGRCSSLVCLRFRESVVGNLAWCRA